jgi:hypothetical protein
MAVNLSEDQIALSHKIEFAVCAFAAAGALSPDSIALLRDAAAAIAAVPNIGGGKYGCNRAVVAEFFTRLALRFEYDPENDDVAAARCVTRERHLSPHSQR